MVKWKKNRDEEVPVFNSSINYLLRLNYWLQQAHLYSNDDDIIDDCFMALEQASIEVDCALNDKDRETLEEMRKETKKKIFDANKNGSNLLILREIVRPFHLMINRFAYDKGLLMLTKDPESMDDLI